VKAEAANPGLGLREIRAVGGVADLTVVKFCQREPPVEGSPIVPSWLWTHAPCRHTVDLRLDCCSDTPPFYSLPTTTTAFLYYLPLSLLTSLDYTYHTIDISTPQSDLSLREEAQ
jgi:hypothetical protein